MAEKVKMVHPDLPNTSDHPVIMDKAGFEAVWKPNGWKLAPKSKPKKKGDE